MKAMLIDRYEKIAALSLGDSPEPALRDNDVMVRIHAEGVDPVSLFENTDEALAYVETGRAKGKVVIAVK